MDISYEHVLEAEIQPLIPFELVEEYNDFVNMELREVLRSNCLRRYLEGAIDLLLKDKIIKISNISCEKWDDYNLNNKIQAIGKYYDKGIQEIFDSLRIIGNSGSHYGNEVSKEDINKGIRIATKIIEIILVKYFKDYPIGSQPPVLTLLSSLPPYSRILILEALWKNGQNDIWVIDKLSMAYLKNNEFEKSLSFLMNLYGQEIIDSNQYQDFVYKISSLYKSIDKFDIAKNIFDVKRIFTSLMEGNNFNDYKEFTDIFMVLISGYRNIE